MAKSLRKLFHYATIGRNAMNVSKCFMSSVNTEIGVIGVPFAKGQTKPGVARGPQRLREAGMLKNLELMGYNVHDYGDLQWEEVPDDPPSYNIKYPRSIGAATKKTAEKVKEIIDSNQVCLSIGGDHSMSIGTVFGHCAAEPDLTLVWVDAHADINPPLASLSGNIHGMVLSFLCHELRDTIPPVLGFEWLKSCLNIRDIAYIGLRDIDSAERYIIDKYGLVCYTVHDIDRHGIHHVLERAIEEINPGLKRPMHLSYDIDSLDPAVSPSTGTPVPGGLTIREGMFIAEELAGTGKLTAIDMVEVNPEIGVKKDQDLTLFTATEVIAACFGKRRKGNVPHGYELPKPSECAADVYGRN